MASAVPAPETFQVGSEGTESTPGGHFLRQKLEAPGASPPALACACRWQPGPTQAQAAGRPSAEAPRDGEVFQGSASATFPQKGPGGRRHPGLEPAPFRGLAGGGGAERSYTVPLRRHFLFCICLLLHAPFVYLFCCCCFFWKASLRRPPADASRGRLHPRPRSLFTAFNPPLCFRDYFLGPNHFRGS